MRYRRDIAGATYMRYCVGTSQRCRICDITSTSQVRPICDIAVGRRSDVEKCNNIEVAATSPRHRRCDLCVISRWDVAAMSHLRYRRDIAGATYTRYHGGTSQRCRIWDIAATSQERPICDIAVGRRSDVEKCNNIGVAAISPRHRRSYL